MKGYLKELLEQQEYDVYAHPGELLEEHVARCLGYFEKIDGEKDLKGILARYIRGKSGVADPGLLDWAWQMFRDIVTSHDIGKVTPEFQRQKMKNCNAPHEVLLDERARHSLLSSVIYLDYYLGKIRGSGLDREAQKLLERLAKLNSYVISRHHGNLSAVGDYFNGLKEGDGNDVLTVLREGKLSGCVPENIRNKDLRMRPEYDSFDYFYCRLAYSVLVACDYYATSENDSGMKMEGFGNIHLPDELERGYEGTSLQQSIRKFEREQFGRMKAEDAEDIDQLRSMMFLEAEREYEKDGAGNIFYLGAPTGSGKSNIALDISIKMMKNRGRKLFYIYPFNTLVEQNRSTLEKLLPSEMYDEIAVVNSLTPIKTGDEDGEGRQRYEKALLDRQFFNYPIVLSTHVTFSDMMLGTGRENAFGFHQLSGAVVVLDEIQSYRNKIWGELMIMLQSCARLMDMQIVIMSATLPDLTVLSRVTDGVSRLLKDPGRYFRLPFFRDRVKISLELLEIKDFSLQLLKDHIRNNHGSGERVLVEFMFKKTADDFYRMLREDDTMDIPIFCITGDDSLFQREKILAPIKNGEIRECILISTQVLEAGADIDMDVGYKNISKLDSEEQFLGRINRSCRRSGIVYFFQLDDAGAIYRGDYRMSRELTLENPEMTVVLADKDFDRYYMDVLQAMKKYGLENTGEDGLERFKTHQLGILDFPAIARRLRLIENDKLAQDVFLCRKITLEDGQVLDGAEVWSQYRNLLFDGEMPFAEKKVKLSRVRARMTHFIYQIRLKGGVIPNEQLGSLMFFEDGESFFRNGRLDRKKLEEMDGLFI